MRSWMIVAAMLLNVACAAQQNLLTDPGFEAGTEAWDGAHQDALVDDARSGGAALRIVCPPDQHHANVDQTVPCEAGRGYRLSAWSRGEARVSLLAWFRNDEDNDVPPVEGGRPYVWRSGPAGLHDWSRTAVVVTPPEGCTRLTLKLYAQDGTAIFDDCEIVATDERENLLLNGGMETRTIPDTPDGWTCVLRGDEAQRDPSVYDAGRWAAVHERPFEGEWSIRDDIPDSDIRSMIADCPPGATVTFSVYLRAEPPMEVGAYIWAGNDAYERSLTTWQVDEQWRRFSTTVTVPPDQGQARVTVKHLPVDGVLWADAAQLEVGEGATDFRASLRDLPVAPVTDARSVTVRVPATAAETMEAPPIAAAEAVGIDPARECLVVDGEPFFGVGMGGVPASHFDEMVVANCNMVMPANLFGEGGEALDVDASVAHAREVLDRAEALRLRVIPWMHLLGDAEYEQWYTDEARRAWLDGVIRGLRDHPAMLAWKITDEPHTVPNEWIQRLYQFFRERDPNHPAFINLGAGGTTEGCMTNYGPFTDIASVDYYPAAREPSLEGIAHYAELLRGIAPGKPLHYWLQYFAGPHWRRLPTPEEQTAMAYLSVIHGTSLITWFIYRPPSDVLWRHVCKLDGELHALAKEHGLLVPPAPNERTVSVADGVHVLVKPREERTLLVAVNALDGPAVVRFELPEALQGHGVRALFEERAIDAGDDGFTDSFAALERHVYVIE